MGWGTQKNPEFPWRENDLRKTMQVTHHLRLMLHINNYIKKQIGRKKKDLFNNINIYNQRLGMMCIVTAAYLSIILP